MRGRVLDVMECKYPNEMRNGQSRWLERHIEVVPLFYYLRRRRSRHLGGMVGEKDGKESRVSVSEYKCHRGLTARVEIGACVARVATCININLEY